MVENPEKIPGISIMKTLLNTVRLILFCASLGIFIPYAKSYDGESYFRLSYILLAVFLFSMYKLLSIGKLKKIAYTDVIEVVIYAFVFCAQRAVLDVI